MICIFTYVAHREPGLPVVRQLVAILNFAHADNRSRRQKPPYFWSAESRPLVKENEDAGD